jgi:hypothetical protein
MPPQSKQLTTYPQTPGRGKQRSYKTDWRIPFYDVIQPFKVPRRAAARRLLIGTGNGVKIAAFCAPSSPKKE